MKNWNSNKKKSLNLPSFGHTILNFRAPPTLLSPLSHRLPSPLLQPANASVIMSVRQKTDKRGEGKREVRVRNKQLYCGLIEAS